MVLVSSGDLPCIYMYLGRIVKSVLVQYLTKLKAHHQCITEVQALPQPLTVQQQTRLSCSDQQAQHAILMQAALHVPSNDERRERKRRVPAVYLYSTLQLGGPFVPRPQK